MYEVQSQVNSGLAFEPGSCVKSAVEMLYILYHGKIIVKGQGP